MSANWRNRTLFHGDNLAFLRAMNSESVDLIATDPPFNKGRDFHATPDSLAAGAKFQDRWSWERDVHGDWVDQLEDDHPAAWAVIDWSRLSYGDDMGAFLCFMGVRLLAMRRVLRPTGSIYLHCDPTASHYLKALMDAIFGRRNFKNEIVWKRAAAHNDPRKCGKIHDTLLFYSKSVKNYTWNAQYTAYSQEYIDAEWKQTPSGRLYKVENMLDPRGRMKEYDFQGTQARWRTSHSNMMILWDHPQTDVPNSHGRIRLGRNGTPIKRCRIIFLDEMPGVPLQTWWGDIKYLSGKSRERAGYPTQKPLALYERIIAASSNEGDVVLDPFCGCATTCVAAENLNRRWVGIDIWDKAHETVVKRLQERGLVAGDRGDKLMTFGDIHYVTVPPARTDDGETAAPFLRVKQRVKEPDGPKWTRAEMYAHLLDQHGPRCMGCDRTFDDPRYLELDHNVPRSDGGINHVTNRILLCGPCNRLKSNVYTLSGLRRENKKGGYMR